MTLVELLNAHSVRPERSVPDWMLGCFRRRCISFANGESDNTTNVYWFQSRNFTIDLRLPRAEEQPHAAELSAYTASELQVLANYEGWVAESLWDGALLSWRGGTALQLHNRWPEPAQLRRIGNCMMEFAPSGAYVEDWRLQASAPGPLIGLRLLTERNLTTGKESARDGGLIICGDHAAWVLGRSKTLPAGEGTLPQRVAAAEGDGELLARLFDFETSIAEGTVEAGYTVRQSTCPGRVGEALLTLEGFEWLGDNRISHTVREQGDTLERIFTIDTFEPRLPFSQITSATENAKTWFARESTTLTRYTQALF